MKYHSVLVSEDLWSADESIHTIKICYSIKIRAIDIVQFNLLTLATN